MEQPVSGIDSRLQRTASVVPPKRKLPRGLHGYLFILPTFVFLLYFMYYPAYTALSGAFTSWDGFNKPQWVGLANFQRALADTDLRIAARNNLIWAVCSIVLAIVPSFVVAELIFFVRSPRSQYIYRTLFVIPLVVPYIVSVLLWRYFYRGDGLLNQVLGVVGVEPVRWLTNPRIALYSLIFMFFPWVSAFNLLIFYSGLQSISVEVLEAARLEGATGLRRIWTVDIPLTRPQFKLLLILAVISSVQQIVVPLVMTGGGPGKSTYVPGLHMYNEATVYGEFGYSMAIAFLLFVVILVLTAINSRFLREKDEAPA